MTSLSKSVDNVSGFTSFLGWDGALIARLVGYASSDLVSAEMIGGVWDFYKERSGGSAGEAGGVVLAPDQPVGGATATSGAAEYIGASKPMEEPENPKLA